MATLESIVIPHSSKSGKSVSLAELWASSPEQGEEIARTLGGRAWELWVWATTADHGVMQACGEAGNCSMWMARLHSGDPALPAHTNPAYANLDGLWRDQREHWREEAQRLARWRDIVLEWLGDIKGGASLAIE